MQGRKGEVEGRGEWRSRVGFILAAAGSAIGLGNIWRFPAETAEHGGAAFLVVYLGAVLLVGLPVMVAELAIGRRTRRNPVPGPSGRSPLLDEPWRSVLSEEVSVQESTLAV